MIGLGLLSAAGLFGLMAGGCVVESVRPVSPFETIARDAQAASLSGEKGPAVAGRSTQSRFVAGNIEVVSLGTVAYDGLTLPLTSPSGRWMVAQEGPPPAWPVVLAASAQIGGKNDAGSSDSMFDSAGNSTVDSAVGRRLSVYRIVNDQLTLHRPIEQIPAGSVLGRSCDDTGFLIERPLDDGSRWIGFVRWDARRDAETGEVQWLVIDEHLNAHATLTPGVGQSSGQSGLAWSRKRLGTDRFEFVYRPVAADRRGEVRLASDDRHYRFPLAFGRACGSAMRSNGSEPLSLWAIALSDRPSDPLELVELSISVDRVSARDSAIVVAQSVPIASTGDASLAYQAVAASQTPAACEACSGVMIFSAGAGGMVYVASNARGIDDGVALRAGLPIMLEQASVCAVPFGSAPNSADQSGCVPTSALVVTPDGLKEVPLAAAMAQFRPEQADGSGSGGDDETDGIYRRKGATRGSVAGTPPRASGTLLLSGSFVVRGSTAPGGRVLLLSPPVKGEDFVLKVFVAGRVGGPIGPE